MSRYKTEQKAQGDRLRENRIKALITAKGTYFQ